MADAVALGFQSLVVHRRQATAETTSEAGSLVLRLEGNVPDCRGMLAEDKSRGVVLISTSVASCSLAVSDLVGGVMAVVGVAAEGERWGGCKLTGDTVMLLCQSARNVTVMRAMPFADWLRVLQATKGDADADLRRAVPHCGGTRDKAQDSHCN